MAKHAGQQLAEYAILLGVVSLAVLTTQLYLSRSVGGGLVARSNQILGEEAPIDEGTSSTTTTSTLNASGRAGSIRTTLVSTTEGTSSSGFILARAYGPYLGVLFRNAPSAAMMAFQLCGGDCTVKEVTTNKKGVVTATIVEKGRKKRISFRVLGVKLYKRGAFMVALLDTTLKGKRLDGKADRLAIGVPKALSKHVRLLKKKAQGPLEVSLETVNSVAQLNQKLKKGKGPINLTDGQAIDITTDKGKAFDKFLSRDGLPEFVRVEENIGTRKFQVLDWYLVDSDDAKAIMKELTRRPSMKVTTRPSDMPTVEEAFAAGMHPDKFGDMTYYYRFNPKATSPKDTPLFEPKKKGRRTAPPSDGARPRGRPVVPKDPLPPGRRP